MELQDLEIGLSRSELVAKLRRNKLISTVLQAVGTGREWEQRETDKMGHFAGAEGRLSRGDDPRGVAHPGFVVNK